MDARQLNNLLIVAFPELEQAYHDEVDWQEGDDTGSHVVFGDVFSPYIQKVICEKNEAEMRRVFDFIEAVLEKNNNYSNEVITFSVLEGIVSDNVVLRRCRKLLGKCTREVVGELRSNL